ncbi:MAG: hypothetical protein EOP88_01570 [Verrucomicrobiaceae bacterium]|nr:MAG: hypothetical protein EOP88_01570 [Verrucomicrobiaceae bacterium]
MKTLLLEAARGITKNQVVWWIINGTLGKVSALFLKLQNARNHQPAAEDERSRFEERCRALFPDLTVLHGPFKGMRYPSLESFGSTLFPKLLGSYEHELAPAIRKITQTPYTAIVDIGCAEGYYAVGLGMQVRNAKLYAFDTNENALDMCRRMAALNGVVLTTAGFCDGKTLKNLDLGNRALVFCDCEGYELELIDRSLAAQMKDHDFLVESHDFIDIEITKKVMGAMGETHDLELIESIDDIIKSYTYDFPELSPFSLSERKRILAEGRPHIMRWIFARSKSHESP